MFHSLQESNPSIDGEIEPTNEMCYFTLSSTLRGYALSSIRHAGSYYIWQRVAALGGAISMAMLTGLVGFWFLSGVGPSYHEVTVYDHVSSVSAPPLVGDAGSILGQSAAPAASLLDVKSHAVSDNTDLWAPDLESRPLVESIDPAAQIMAMLNGSTPMPDQPVAPSYPPYAYSGIDQPGVYSNPYDAPLANPLEPSTIEHGGIPIGPWVSVGDQLSQPDTSGVGQWVGGAGDPAIAGFSLDSPAIDSVATSHTEMQEYTTWWTVTKGILRLLLGFASVIITGGLLVFAIERLHQLIITLRTKLAAVPNRDVIRAVDPRGRQLSMLHESMRDAVRRHNLAAGEPVSVEEVMDLFKDALHGHTELSVPVDVMVSAYVINSDHLQQPLGKRGCPHRKDLKRQMRKMADGAADDIVPGLCEHIYRRLDRHAGREAEQLFLERSRSDEYVASVQATLLGTNHLVKQPV
jgi:hypothetical protein